MGFSFTRRDSDPDRARSDLAAAVEIIAAAEEVEKALEDATERLKRDLTDEALDEQQRLIAGAARIKAEAGAACRHRLSGGTIWRKTKHRKSTRPKRATRPLIDLNDASIKKMIARAKKRGVVTYRRAQRGPAAGPDVVRADRGRHVRAQRHGRQRRRERRGVDDDEEEDKEPEPQIEDEVDPLDDGGPRPAAATKKEPTDRTDDPVRMYLREMGAVELLSREGEIAIAKRIEAGRDTMIWGLCESPITFNAIIGWSNALNEGRMQLREILDLEAMLSQGPDRRAAHRDRGRRRRRGEGEISEKVAGPSIKEEEEVADEPEADANEDDEDMVERRTAAAGRGRGRGQHPLASPRWKRRSSPRRSRSSPRSPRSSRNSPRSRRARMDALAGRPATSPRPTRRSTRSCASSSPPRSRASSSTARKIEYLVDAALQLQPPPDRARRPDAAPRRAPPRAAPRLPRKLHGPRARRELARQTSPSSTRNGPPSPRPRRDTVERIRTEIADIAPGDRHLARRVPPDRQHGPEGASARRASPRRKWSRPTSASSSRSPRNTPTAACSSSTSSRKATSA